MRRQVELRAVHRGLAPLVLPLEAVEREQLVLLGANNLVVPARGPHHEAALLRAPRVLERHRLRLPGHALAP